MKKKILYLFLLVITSSIWGMQFPRLFFKNKNGSYLLKLKNQTLYLYKITAKGNKKKCASVDLYCTSYELSPDRETIFFKHNIFAFFTIPKEHSEDVIIRALQVPDALSHCIPYHISDEQKGVFFILDEENGRIFMNHSHYGKFKEVAQAIP